MSFSIGGSIDENGKLSVFYPDVMRAYIKANKGKVIELSIKVKKAKRSNPLNAYYWGVVVQMICKRFNDLGNEMDEDETHDTLKKMFNSKEIVGLGDNFIERPGSTTKMDNIEFMSYLERIKQFAADLLDIYIPDPHEQLNMDF